MVRWEKKRPDGIKKDNERKRDKGACALCSQPLYFLGFY